MNGKFSDSGKATALILVCLIVLAIPVGLALGQGMPQSQTATDPEAVITPTLPPLKLTATATPTPTGSAQPPQGNDTTHIVDDDVRPGKVTSEAECPDAKHGRIQDAVEEANQGNTVVVCAGTYKNVTIETANLTLLTHGGATIESTGEPAVQIHAPRVIIHGFTIRASQAKHTIAVGGRETRIQETTVNVTVSATDVGPDIGIFLSDGRTAEGNPDSNLGAATQSRIVNNTFEVRTPPESDYSAFGVWADADQTVIRNNDFTGHRNATSIYSTGNATEIRNNTLQYPTPPYRSPGPFAEQQYPQRPAIQIGATLCHETRRSPDCNDREKKINNVSAPSHNWATQNLIVNNSIDGAPRNGIFILKVATETIVRDNDIFNTPQQGIHVRANETLIQSNTISDIPNLGIQGSGINIRGYNLQVIGNTVSRTDFGIAVGRGKNMLLSGNQIQDISNNGVYFRFGSDASGRVVNNIITGNQGSGITVNPSLYTGNDRKNITIKVHRNRIWDNSIAGLQVQNWDKTDGEWPILNATNNIWGCGGPSGGLEDPHTERVANGTGDRISAGDKVGVSNIHFDPFFVREDATCSAGMAQPTQTPTPTPTPTSSPMPTPTLTSTPTPSPTPASGFGNGTGGTEGNGTSGTGNGTGDTGSSGEPGQNTFGATTTGTPPQSTATPTPPPTPTISPTPRVEPGFGVYTWIVGAAILVGFLVIRRRGKNHD